LNSGLTTPTPIQEQAIPAALIQRRDVIAAAETGSGKTMAYGLPILSQLAYMKEEGRLTEELHALIVAPTRELALQASRLAIGKMAPIPHKT
jgi:superfamily II DNA/RNA helicase